MYGLSSRAVLACFVAASGCYRYADTTLATVPENTEVEMLLSSEGQVNLRERVGLDRGTLRGELIEKNGETVLISVQSVSAFTGVGTGPLYQRIDLPARDILRVRTRETDTARTVGLVGGIVLGAGGLVAALIAGEARNEDPPTPGGPEERTVGWLLQIPFLTLR